MKLTHTLCRIAVAFLLFQTPLLTDAQNFVSNPGFETYSSLPTGYGQITRAIGWNTPNGGSSDYFHNSGSGGAVPSNWFGSEPPHGGNAFAGVARSQAGSYHEYLQVQLTGTLTAGQNYYCEAYASAGEGGYRYGTNNLGFYFTPSALSVGGTGVILASPQFNWTSPITTITGWEMISGNFVAAGTENWVSVGNFFSTAATTWVNLGTSATIASMYVFVDDLVVQPAAILSEGALMFNATPKDNKYVELVLGAESEVAHTTHFSVQRSFDGDSYTEIDRIEPNASGIAEFTITDTPNVFDEPVFYRVKQLTDDGEIRLSEVEEVVLETPDHPEILAVYPVPAVVGGSLLMDYLAVEDGELILSVIDMYGKTVFREVYTVGYGKNILDFSQAKLSAGNYVILAESQNGIRNQSRLVVTN